MLEFKKIDVLFGYTKIIMENTANYPDINFVHIFHIYMRIVFTYSIAANFLKLKPNKFASQFKSTSV